MEKLLQIKVEDNVGLHYGQRVYAIWATGNESYKSKCPICGGSGKITVSGKEFSCPECGGRGTVRDEMAILYNYKVLEVVINRVEIVGEYKVYDSCNKPLSISGVPQMKYKGVFLSDFNIPLTFDFSCWHFDENGHGTIPGKESHDGSQAFLCKEEAEAFVKSLHKEQVKKLEKFNAENGTDYQYPFEY